MHYCRKSAHYAAPRCLALQGPVQRELLESSCWICLLRVVPSARSIIQNCSRLIFFGSRDQQCSMVIFKATLCFFSTRNLEKQKASKAYCSYSFTHFKGVIHAFVLTCLFKWTNLTSENKSEYLRHLKKKSEHEGHLNVFESRYLFLGRTRLLHKGPSV